MPKESAVGKVDAKKHWAFQPVKAVTVPPLAATDREYNEIDHFVIAKLKEKGLTPAPPADRRTLLRRRRSI